MYNSENQFEKNVVEILSSNRNDVKTQFKPFNNLKLTVDIKSYYNNLEEWRELKIVFYKNGGNSIQNLWKGIGKIRLMQRLADKLLVNKKNSIINILTLPNYDFDKIDNRIQEVVVELVYLEVLKNKELINLSNMELN